MTMDNDSNRTEDLPDQPSRREFVGEASRFAVATTAAVTVLLSTSMEAGATKIGISGKGSGPSPRIRRRRRRFRRRMVRRYIMRLLHH